MLSRGEPDEQWPEFRVFGAAGRTAQVREHSETCVGVGAGSLRLVHGAAGTGK